MMLSKLLTLLLGRSDWLIKQTNAASWEGWREGRALERSCVAADLDDLDPSDVQTPQDVVDVVLRRLNERGGVK